MVSITGIKAPGLFPSAPAAAPRSCSLSQLRAPRPHN